MKARWLSGEWESEWVATGMGQGDRRKRTEHCVLARRVITGKSSKEACGAGMGILALRNSERVIAVLVTSMIITLREPYDIIFRSALGAASRLECIWAKALILIETQGVGSRRPQNIRRVRKVIKNISWAWIL